MAFYRNDEPSAQFRRELTQIMECIRKSADVWNDIILKEKRVLILDGGTATLMRTIRPGYHLLPDHMVKDDSAVVSAIHRMYLEAGADIISTDTFNANSLSLGSRGDACEINRTATALARRQADLWMRGTGKSVYVAGVMGPGAFRAAGDMGMKGCVDSDSISEAFHDQSRCLAEEGADLLLLETVWDTGTLAAILEGLRQADSGLPVVVSATVKGDPPLTPSGQDISEFIDILSVSEDVVCAGINCSGGPLVAGVALKELAAISPYAVSFHPNARNFAGSLSPDRFTEAMREIVEGGFTDIAGGCCGCGPAHIRALSALDLTLPRRLRRASARGRMPYGNGK